MYLACAMIYAMRGWTPNREKIGKGVAMLEEEVKELKRLLNR